MSIPELDRGRCRDCKKPVAPHSTSRCKVHLKKAARARISVYRDRRKDGICVQCQGLTPRSKSLCTEPSCNGRLMLEEIRRMLLVGDQPYRYGSVRLAKSRVMFMVMKGPTIPDPTVNRWHVKCVGNQGHYQRDTGICAHVEVLDKAMSAWHRARTWFLPFGNTDAEEVKL